MAKLLRRSILLSLCFLTLLRILKRKLAFLFFERVGRNVRLTEYGEEFNKHICCALDEIDKAVEIMKAYNSGLSGRIRIGTVISN